MALQVKCRPIVLPPEQVKDYLYLLQQRSKMSRQIRIYQLWKR